MYGNLVPEGGGDPIPLFKEKLLLGRRESCDVVLRFSNVSAHHCELELREGWWFVKDLNSQNGTRVNGYRVAGKRLDPGDKLSFARHDYRVDYSPEALGAEGPPPDEDIMSEIMSRSLLESAGLDRQRQQISSGRVGRPAAPSTPETDADADSGADADRQGDTEDTADEAGPPEPPADESADPS